MNLCYRDRVMHLVAHALNGDVVGAGGATEDVPRLTLPRADIEDIRERAVRYGCPSLCSYELGLRSARLRAEDAAARSRLLVDEKITQAHLSRDDHSRAVMP